MNKRNNPSNAGDETPNIKDEPQQPTLQNADYKMTVSSVQQWYNILNIRHYEHLYEAYHIHWADTMDKSGDTLLETKIKIAELPPNRKEKKKQKNQKIPTTLMKYMSCCYTTPPTCHLYNKPQRRIGQSQIPHFKSYDEGKRKV